MQNYNRSLLQLWVNFEIDRQYIKHLVCIIRTFIVIVRMLVEFYLFSRPSIVTTATRAMPTMALPTPIALATSTETAATLAAAASHPQPLRRVAPGTILCSGSLAPSTAEARGPGIGSIISTLQQHPWPPEDNAAIR